LEVRGKFRATTEDSSRRRRSKAWLRRRSSWTSDHFWIIAPQPISEQTTRTAATAMPAASICLKYQTAPFSVSASTSIRTGEIIAP